MLFALFTRFVLVGAVATGLHYLLLFSLIHWTGANPVLASALGFIASAFANYLLNYHYTFRSNRQHGPALLKFMVIAGIGLILNSTIMQMLTVAGLHYLIAQVIATVAVLLWNFAGNNLWTFRAGPTARMTAPVEQSRGNKNSRRSDWGVASVTKRIILVSLTVLALLIAAQEEPLEDMHWDVPIYLYQAKRFAETHYLANYAHHAAEVAAQVQGHWPADEGYSEAFWHFIRLGHIAVLGGMVGLFGNTLATIAFSTWLYTLFLMAGIAFLFITTLIFGRMREPAQPWFAGTAISLLLFLLSDIYRYLAGNLVSEVLSIFLLGAALLALLRSVNAGHLSLAILSGVLAFISYTVRVESVWTWLTFLLAYVVAGNSDPNQSVPWKPFLAAGFTALGLYAAYTAIFYPLTDPRLYLSFVSGLTTSDTHRGVPGYQLLFVAGGLLWVGALICLRWLKLGLVRLGWLWLVLSALPWLPQIILGGPSQTRMMTLLIPALFLLSSTGWSLLLEQVERRPLKIAAAASLCLALISQPAVYVWLHSIPGIWRVQFVQPFLFAPNYERANYLPMEMAALSHAVYNTDKPTVLVSEPELGQHYLNLIRFFGAKYSSTSDLALKGDPTNKKSCDYNFAVLDESVLFCQGYADPVAMRAHRGRYRILFLRPVKVSAMPGRTLLLKTPAFTLDELRN